MPIIFNLLVLPWFVTPVYTWESHVENCKIQILGTYAIPNLNLKVKWGSIFLKYPPVTVMNHHDLKPLVYTLDSTANVYDFLQG